MRKIQCRSQTAAGLFAAGVIGLIGAALVWSGVSSARERRRRIRHGEVRELTSLWTTVADCRIHARASASSGDPTAPPVVLVQGFGISNSYFVPTAEFRAPQFAVYAPDLPGPGRSDTLPGQLDVSQLADSLAAWMDATGLPRASLVGNSTGCQIAVDAAVRHPDRVDRLVLIGPTADPAGRTSSAHLRRLIIGGLYERPSLNKLLLTDYARMGPRLLPELRFMLRNRIEERLPHVSAPTMLVRGEKDPIVPQPWFGEAARLVRAERPAAIRGGHAVHYSAAGELVQAISPFLRVRSVARSPSCESDPKQAGQHGSW